MSQSPLLTVLKQPKMTALLLLGFASGVPLYLTSKTLQAWMTVAQVDLSKIGLFSLVALPYSLKFLWAPLLDRYVPPFLGRRRGWLAIFQIALVLAIAAMGVQNPAQGLYLLAVNALIIAFFSASHDIALDAYRTDVLEREEMGIGASTYVFGYRIALLLTGSLALILADHLPWPLVYVLMALLMFLGIATSIVAPEPTKQPQPPASLTEAVIQPFQEFFQRYGILKAFVILLFVILFRLGDALAGNMATPFLLKIGFTQTDIGAIQGGMGLVATIVGVLIGGAIVTKIGIHKSLWIFGILQAASNLAYVVLAQAGKSYPLMVAAINIENLCAGFATAGLVAFLMSICNPRFTATQYALVSSLMAVSRDILAAPAGQIASETGWPLFFGITLIAALPGIALLPFFAPWSSQTQAQ